MAKKRLSDDVYSKTEPERHRLEVKYVLAKKTDKERDDYLNGVREKRAESAYQRLRQNVLKAWKK